MAIHLVISVGDENYRVTLSRDDSGNYVAEANGALGGKQASGVPTPHIRVVDPTKEHALRSLLDSLQRVTSNGHPDPQLDGNGAPAIC
jgi:hypothetical protein